MSDEKKDLTPEELKKLFKLDEKPKTPSKQESLKPTKINKRTIPQDHAIKNLDHWDIHRGQILFDTKGQDALKEDLVDFHACAFKPKPLLHESCKNERKLEFIKQLIDTPEYRAIHTTSMFNAIESGIAAWNFLDAFNKMQEQDCNRNSSYCKGGKKPPSDKTKAENNEMALIQGVGKALKNATKGIEETKEILSAFGYGAMDSNISKLDYDKIAELFKKVRDNDRIRKICQRAGRFRRYAQSKQRQKVIHGYDDMLGVEMGGDLQSLIPSELAMLVCEEFEDHTMKRLVEKQCMQRQFKGKDNVGKGPIIVCVDESGSMQGKRIIDAKAFALSLCWIARNQKRHVVLSSFSDKPRGIAISLPPNEPDSNKLFDWLGHFFSGGTALDYPIYELPLYEFDAFKLPKGKTDMILITDGEVPVHTYMIKWFNKWKKQNQVRCISLLLDHNGTESNLSTFSEEVYYIKDIDIIEEGVSKCLSI